MRKVNPPSENQTTEKRRYLLANVLIIGAQGCIKFESSLSQLMRMLQIMIQLQVTNTKSQFALLEYRVQVTESFKRNYKDQKLFEGRGSFIAA